MSNDSNPIQIISEFLQDLGYKGTKIEQISRKILEEILDKVLLQLLTSEEQKNLIEALAQDREDDVKNILGQIDSQKFNSLFETETSNSLKDIISKLLYKLSEEELSKYSPQLEQIENKYKLRLQFSQKDPKDILSLLAK